MWKILCHLKHKYVYFTRLILIHFISDTGHPAFQDIGSGCQKKTYRSTTNKDIFLKIILNIKE